jgi:dTMP kinase
MRKGLFITFEGSDGSGKSTQLSLLKEYLIQKGIKILTLREPGGVAISEKIRKIILDNKNTEMSPVTEMLLYAASRAQLVSQVIKPSLEKGITVICDRFVDSSYVYQGLARGLGIDTVKLVNDIATETYCRILPFLWISTPELALKRRFNESIPDRLENENISFHRDVYNGYLKLTEMYPERIKRINGEIGIDAAFSSIKKYIDDLLCRYIK